MPYTGAAMQRFRIVSLTSGQQAHWQCLASMQVRFPAETCLYLVKNSHRTSNNHYVDQYVEARNGSVTVSSQQWSPSTLCPQQITVQQCHYINQRHLILGSIKKTCPLRRLILFVTSECHDDDIQCFRVWSSGHGWRCWVRLQLDTTIPPGHTKGQAFPQTTFV